MAQNIAAQSTPAGQSPWFQRAMRWSYLDPRHAEAQNVDWWRAYWQRLGAQGVVIPTTYGGDAAAATALAAGARRDGLAVVMLLDTATLDAAVAAANPNWVARQADQTPIAAYGGVAACINGAYFQEQVPAQIRKLAADVDGVLGVGWSGLGRTQICYCAACTAQFTAAHGGALPAAVQLNDAQYLHWIVWNEARRVDLWKRNDAAASGAKPNSRWIGCIPAAREAQLQALIDVPAIAQTAALFFVDGRVAVGAGRFRTLYQDGRYLAAVAGEKPVVLISNASHISTRTFAAASTGPTDGRLRLTTAMAAGLQPAIDLGPNPLADPRTLEIAPPVFQWHRANEETLRGRVPVGDVGVVWSETTAQAYGGAQSPALVDAPYKGVVDALMRGHVPYRTLRDPDMSGGLSGISVLVLPNVAIMSEQAIDAVRRFVRGGGHLIATGQTSLFQADGTARANFALADVFGVDLQGPPPTRLAAITAEAGAARFGGATTVGGSQFHGMATDHSYVELLPKYQGLPAGAPRPPRHEILRGFDQTDFLAYGGVMTPLRVQAGRTVLMTYVRPFPQMPVDQSYIREKTDLPGFVVGQFGAGRVAFLAADFDRRHGIDADPDHTTLLLNTIRWARGMDVASPVTVVGNGVIVSALYQRSGAWVLHLLNLTGADNQAGVVRDPIRVAGVQVSLALPAALRGDATLLVSGQAVAAQRSGARLELTVPELREHEVVVIR